MSAPSISQAADDLIVEEEVSSEAAYRRRYAAPTWPGGGSGVTIGIGYDVGTQAPATVTADWTPHLGAVVVRRLVQCCGVLGQPAQGMAVALNDVTVPWESARLVFRERTLPAVMAQVLAKVPNASELSPDSLGALVSLAYNRGASFTAQGDRYREMRAIADAGARRAWAEVPGQIRAMRRLWAGAGLDGLLRRRDREAELFERGLAAAPPVIPVAPVVAAPLGASAPPEDRNG